MRYGNQRSHRTPPRPKGGNMRRIMALQNRASSSYIHPGSGSYERTIDPVGPSMPAAPMPSLPAVEAGGGFTPPGSMGQYPQIGRYMNQGTRQKPPRSRGRRPARKRRARA